ncbi:MAG TPA: tetratricopeptide repeat protein [Albitalea sp.]|uniref:tetratricopeptide repeat protein n=1 Tax=Piscinibacter sp. TaxID=1903157 RepID=UPI002ECFD586
MRTWISLLCCAWLVGCAQAPLVTRGEHLLRDELFNPPAQAIQADEVFAISDEMRAYVRNEIIGHSRGKSRQQALADALYQRGGLRLEYDASATRNAAEAFHARSGNCLSLVIMTAAFARELGLRVEYQSALNEEAWSRSAGLYLRSGHVNLTLGRRIIDAGPGDSRSVTIDFLASEDVRRLRTRIVDERTVLAMYMNNRAAEALVAQRLDDAYAWAREAVVQGPAFLSAFNTLGVIYLRHGNLAPAEQVFRHVLEREPANTRAMYNLAQVLVMLGRDREAAEWQHKLAQIEPNPPFHFFNLGIAAMARNDFRAARDLFAREVDRADYYHEFHFWLAQASFGLGDFEQARKHLALAMDSSTTRRDHDLYAAKLAWMKSHGYQ